MNTISYAIQGLCVYIYLILIDHPSKKDILVKINRSRVGHHLHFSNNFQFSIQLCLKKPQNNTIINTFTGTRTLKIKFILLIDLSKKTMKY
jgi:hypothetical protein